MFRKPPCLEVMGEIEGSQPKFNNVLHDSFTLKLHVINLLSSTVFSITASHILTSRYYPPKLNNGLHGCFTNKIHVINLSSTMLSMTASHRASRYQPMLNTVLHDCFTKTVKVCYLCQDVLIIFIIYSPFCQLHKYLKKFTTVEKYL